MTTTINPPTSADIVGLLAPRVVEMIGRVLAEGVPHGWTAEASSYILLAHEASGREIVASYHGEPITERGTWWGACAPTDDDPDRQVGGDTLAELIELVTA